MIKKKVLIGSLISSATAFVLISNTYAMPHVNFRNDITRKVPVLKKRLSTQKPVIKRFKTIPNKVLPKMQKLRKKVHSNKKLILNRNIIRKRLEKSKLFKEQIEKIKDARKKKIASHIKERLSLLNERLGDRLENVANMMLKIADRLQNRAKRLEEKGANVKDIYTKLEKFKTNVNEFKSKVENQKAKTYTPDIENEKNLGQALRKSIKDFRTDFKVLKKELFNLRKELIQILIEMRGLHNPTVTPVISK